MKKFAASLVLLFTAVLTNGLRPSVRMGLEPGVLGEERHKMIARNWDYEGKQIFDDIDAALLLRPMSPSDVVEPPLKIARRFCGSHNSQFTKETPSSKCASLELGVFSVGASSRVVTSWR
jgi:hypothetical protein